MTSELKPQIKCKNWKGIRVCTFNAGGRNLIFKTSLSSFEPIKIELFTSNTCSWCPEAKKKIQKTIKPLKGMVKIIEKNVDDDAFKNVDEIQSLPTIKIGQDMMVGDVDEPALWTSLFNAITGSQS